MKQPLTEQQRAEVYSNRLGFGIVDDSEFGFGTDGRVFRSSRRTAVKTLERQRAYEAERDSYLRLSERGIIEIAPFAVPKLRGYDDELRVVEMSIVTPPYLLDFGKCYVDRPPPFDAEQLAEAEEAERELFDPADWTLVESALLDLRLIGLHYLDSKPANIRVR